MNKINRIGVFRLAVLMAVISASSAISLPVLAQVNPHPSIFNEPLYNHRHQRGPRLGHRHGPLLGQGAVDNGPPGGGPRGGPTDNGGPAGGPADNGGPRGGPADNGGPTGGPRGGPADNGGPAGGPPASRPGS